MRDPLGHKADCHRSRKFPNAGRALGEIPFEFAMFSLFPRNLQMTIVGGKTLGFTGISL